MSDSAFSSNPKAANARETSVKRRFGAFRNAEDYGMRLAQVYCC